MKITHNIAIAAICAAIAVPALKAADCDVPVAVVSNSDRLTGALTVAANASGLAGDPDLALFVISARVEPVSQQVISGIQPTVAVEANVTIKVYNRLTREVFASAQVPVRGAGVTEQAALDAAAASIRAKSPEAVNFLADARQRIGSYYEAKCPGIIAQAKAAASTGEYEKAMWLLASVPDCCSGYADVLSAIVDIYTYHIDDVASTLIAQARTLAAKGDYTGALDLLAAVDPSSICYSNATTLVDDIASRCDAARAHADEIATRREADTRALRLAQIEASRTLATLYYCPLILL